MRRDPSRLVGAIEGRAEVRVVAGVVDIVAGHGGVEVVRVIVEDDAVKRKSSPAESRSCSRRWRGRPNPPDPAASSSIPPCTCFIVRAYVQAD